MKSKIALLLALVVMFAIFAAGCNREQLPVNKPDESSSVSEPDEIIEPEPESEPESESQSESKPEPPKDGGQVIAPPASGTGSSTGTGTTAGNLYISKAGTKISNRTVTGDVYIQKSVGKGDVYLTDVKVTGTIHVNGGGQNSVYLHNVTAKNLIIDYDNNKVRVVLSGKSEIKTTTIRTPAILVEKDLNSNFDGFKDVTTQQAHGYIYLPLELDGARLDSLNARIKTYVETSGGASMGDTSDSRIKPEQGSPNSGGGGGSNRPVPVTAVSITGDALVGKTLTATVTPSNATSKTYKWYVTDAADTPITSSTPVAATASTYIPKAADVGKFIRVQVTAGGDTKISPATSAVAAIPVTAVTISNAAPKFGDTITANITPADATNPTYQWYRGTTPITDATAKTYTVTADDVGSEIKVTVTTLGGATVTSAATAAVPPIPVTSVTLDKTSPKVGDIITATVNPTNATSPTYKWYRADSLIVSATGSTYTVTEGDIGSSIKVAVTAGGATITSNPTAVVSEIPVISVTLSKPSPTVGDAITATINPTNATNPTYKWYRGSDLIDGQTTNQYTATVADVDKVIKVEVTAGGTMKSASTAKVQPVTQAAAAADLAVPGPAGTVVEGVTVTPVAGKITITNNIALDDGKISGNAKDQLDAQTPGIGGDVNKGYVGYTVYAPQIGTLTKVVAYIDGALVASGADVKDNAGAAGAKGYVSTYQAIAAKSGADWVKHNFAQRSFKFVWYYEGGNVIATTWTVELA